MADKKLTVLVSSTVYGIEELLDRIYTLLTQFGYEVWMSHKGTMPVSSRRSAFGNCLTAVERCDLFLGIITPQYGSGKEGKELSIVHQEVQKAIELNKPRWILAHDHVIFARLLLGKLGYDTKEKRAQLTLKPSVVMGDLRVIDLYEEATQTNSEESLLDRQGNWVQKFESDPDAALFVTAQFSRYQEAEEFVQENLSDSAQIAQSVHGKRTQKGVLKKESPKKEPRNEN